MFKFASSKQHCYIKGAIKRKEIISTKKFYILHTHCGNDPFIRKQQPDKSAKAKEIKF